MSYILSFIVLLLCILIFLLWLPPAEYQLPELSEMLLYIKNKAGCTNQRLANEFEVSEASIRRYLKGVEPRFRYVRHIITAVYFSVLRDEKDVKNRP